MITTKGKSIVAKYLLGQTPAYASYIALGCGPKPLDTTDNFGDYAPEFSAKTDLDFEMFRVPIISKGYVTEDVGEGNMVSKIILTAELPTEDRYEITEIGIYSAGSNPSAGTAGSKMLFTFSDNEAWEYHSGSTSVAIPKKTSSQISVSGNDMNDSALGKYFRMDSDSTFLSDATRVARQERPRFLNGSIVLRGDVALLTDESGDGFLQYVSGDHIHLSNISLNLDSSSPNDEIRLAFSLLSKEAASGVTAVSDIKIMIEFASNHESTEYARFNVDMGTEDQEFTTNRYVVASQTLGQMEKSPNFSWNAVNIAKIYVTANSYGSSADEIFVALDALRLESVNSTANNPLYGLTGYTIIKDANQLPIVKEPNTSNFVEFRFAMDVT